MRASGSFTISPGCKGKNAGHLQNQTVVPHLQGHTKKIKQVKLFNANPIQLSYVLGLYPGFQSEPSDGLLKIYIFQTIFSKVPQVVLLIERMV